MFYVLFQYKKGQEEKGFRRFKSLSEVEEFLWKDANGFSFFKIIEVKKEYTAKWVFTAIGDTSKKPKTRGRPRKKERQELQKEEEEENENEELLNKVDKAIETAKKMREDKEKDWELCIKCKTHKVAPSNKKKTCFSCLPPKENPTTLVNYESRTKEE